MKHLLTNESWLSDKLSTTNDTIKRTITDFTNPFEFLIKKVKNEWSIEYEAEVVKTDIIDNITESFNNLLDSINEMSNIDDIKYVYDDIDQSIVQLNNSLIVEIDKTLVSESIKRYSEFITINEAQESIVESLKASINGIFGVIKMAITEYREEYIEQFIEDGDGGENKFDTIRENSKKLIKKLSQTIVSNIKELDVQVISNDAKSKVENKNSVSNKPKVYSAGTILKHTKINGEDNIAEVASSQEENSDMINMISVDGKDKFSISRNSIIGVADENGEVEVTPEDIVNGIEDNKDDSKKMNRLKKYIENDL